MPERGVVIAALGLIVIGGGLFAARSVLVDEPAAEDAAAAAPAEMAAPVETEPAAAKAARVRPVAPDVVAQPRVQPDELQRVEPRDALSRFAQPLPKPPPRNLGRVYRPYIDAAGRAAGSGVVVTLAGIEVTSPDKTCTDAEGHEWPCGMRARSAFRGFVRGRALACDLPPELTEKSYTVACKLGGRDVGEWLVGQGWAMPALGSDRYAQLASEAREAGRGMYGAAPPVFDEPVGQADAALGDAGLDGDVSMPPVQ